MKRNEFLKKAALATFVLHSSSLAGILTYGRPTGFLRSGKNLSVADLEIISQSLQTKVDNLFITLKKNGWITYIKSLNLGITDHLDIAKLITAIPEEKLNTLKTMTGFEDFGGNRFIEPGYPALSLLYHLLANPRVRPGGFSEIQYARLNEIDIMEDYIYGLKNWVSYKKDYEIENDNNLVLAVFAYEYRTAFKTPHHQSADMVYSRTGIGRIGNRQPLYNKENRCYTNNPSLQPGDKNIAVTPARYGLFIARKVSLLDNNGKQHLSALKMSRDKQGDRHFIKNSDNNFYLLPIRKIFNDDWLINSSVIGFSEQHFNKKISTLLPDTHDKYTRTSASLVNTIAVNSSFIVESQYDDLIKGVKNENNDYLQFHANKGGLDNRFLTGYFNSNGSSEVEDIELLDPSGLSRSVNNYGIPRKVPMYVNLSHTVINAQIKCVDRFGSNATETFEMLMNSERNVPLFEDKICDGYVTATVKSSSKNQLKILIDKGVLNAFSIITAPDFFPQVDGFDLQNFDIAPGMGDNSLFYEGGIASLATSNTYPNPMVYEKDAKILKDLNPRETYTTVISNYKNEKIEKNKFNDPGESRGYYFSSYLPDVCSSVFAPGWDITYQGEDKDDKQIFLSTQGLGAPFIEDMKFCAALNGMWPAAAPDVSRTYQASVTADELCNFDWDRNPTAIPLLDNELGFNDQSPAVKYYGQRITLGWDGEQGPFLELTSKKDNKDEISWHVNFTDLGRADYVENTLQNILDMSKLRELDGKELNFRMHCLNLCLQKLNQFKYPDPTENLWLISAEKVNWNKTANGHGIPKHLLTDNNNWAIQPKNGMNSDGYLYVFSDFKPDPDRKSIYWVENGHQTKRRRVNSNTLFVCQVNYDKAIYYKIKIADATKTYNEKNWI